MGGSTPGPPRTSIWRHGALGCSCSRTSVLYGERADPTGVALDGPSGSIVGHFGSPSPRPSPFLQVVPEPLVERQRGLSKGDGVAIDPHVCCHRSGARAAKGCHRDRRAASRTTAAAAQAPKGCHRHQQLRESSFACDAVVVEPPRHIAASSAPKNSFF